MPPLRVLHLSLPLFPNLPFFPSPLTLSLPPVPLSLPLPSYGGRSALVALGEGRGLRGGRWHSRVTTGGRGGAREKRRGLRGGARGGGGRGGRGDADGPREYEAVGRRAPRRRCVRRPKEVRWSGRQGGPGLGRRLPAAGGSPTSRPSPDARRARPQASGLLRPLFFPLFHTVSDPPRPLPLRFGLSFTLIFYAFQSFSIPSLPPPPQPRSPPPAVPPPPPSPLSRPPPPRTPV